MLNWNEVISCDSTMSLQISFSAEQSFFGCFESVTSFNFKTSDICMLFIYCVF